MCHCIESKKHNKKDSPDFSKGDDAKKKRSWLFETQIQLKAKKLLHPSSNHEFLNFTDCPTPFVTIRPVEPRPVLQNTDLNSSPMNPKLFLGLEGTKRLGSALCRASLKPTKRVVTVYVAFVHSIRTRKTKKYKVYCIEREITSLQLEEKRLVAEIKQTAKTGNEAATKILARQLVRLRQQITNLQGSRAQIRGVTTHTQALYASTSISSGMKGATTAMVAMNKIEMMSEAIDETLDKDEAEEETEDLTNQVLDEIGVGVASQLSSAPKGRIATKTAAPTTVNNKNDSESTEVDDLERRLASLRRI
ncbi:hypothetical protein F2Q69_00033586 [Brassica cretica]|uniref:Uncharacterized protein n=1 Tax=Brassica cretica TaxID=69181 RepID=A0A8S9SFW6_BRACR|nr:hypothetical protein F2Q69_00033586 [Brassica cretica]